MPSIWWRLGARVGRVATAARWILCYHRIGGSVAAGGTPWPVFRDHLGILRGRAVPLGAILDGSAPPGSAAVTFDGAYAEQGEALRACLAAGAPPTLFVPTAYVETGLPFWWEGREAGEVERIKRAMRRGAPPPEGGRTAALLGWNDLARLRDEGVRIETNGHAHRILTGLDADDVAADVWRSIEILKERLGVEASALAYPHGDWGDFDAKVAHVAGRYGIRWGLTTVFGAARPEREPHALRRVVVTDEPAAAIRALLDGGDAADAMKRWYDRLRARWA